MRKARAIRMMESANDLLGLSASNLSEDNDWRYVDVLNFRCELDELIERLKGGEKE